MSQTTKYLHGGSWSTGFIVHFAFSALFATIAFLWVYFDISAAGSGLPEVKR